MQTKDLDPKARKTEAYKALLDALTAWGEQFPELSRTVKDFASRSTNLIYRDVFKIGSIEYREYRDRVNLNRRIRRAESPQTPLLKLCRRLSYNRMRSEAEDRELYGYSPSVAFDHIASQFEPWMTWGNRAKDTWHVDHIQPLASFDLTIREEFLAANCFTNLRPLKAAENYEKGHKTP